MESIFENKDNKIKLEVVTKVHSQFICDLSNNETIMKIFHNESSSIGDWESFVDIWQMDEDENNYIISCEGEHVGWIGINGLLSEDKIVWIKVIAILPEYFGMGYGSMAIDEIKKIFKLKGFKKMQLWTDEVNKRAQKCYKANGFDITGRKTGKVGVLEKEVERILMSCIL